MIQNVANVKFVIKKMENEEDNHGGYTDNLADIMADINW